MILFIWEDEAAARLQAGCSALTKRGSHGIEGLLQQKIISLHVRAVFGLLVENVAELGVRLTLARTKHAVDVKDLLRMRKAEADIAIIEHIDQKIGLERIDCLGG